MHLEMLHQTNTPIKNERSEYGLDKQNLKKFITKCDTDEVMKKTFNCNTALNFCYDGIN